MLCELVEAQTQHANVDLDIGDDGERAGTVGNEIELLRADGIAVAGDRINEAPARRREGKAHIGRGGLRAGGIGKRRIGKHWARHEQSHGGGCSQCMGQSGPEQLSTRDTHVKYSNLVVSKGCRMIFRSAAKVKRGKLTVKVNVSGNDRRQDMRAVTLGSARHSVIMAEFLT